MWVSFRFFAKGRVFWLKLRAGCDWKTETISTSLGQIKGSTHAYRNISIYTHIDIFYTYTHRETEKVNPNVHARVFVYQHLYLHNQPKVAERFEARWFRIEWDTIGRSHDSRTRIINPKRWPICTLLRKQGVMKHDEALVYSLYIMILYKETGFSDLSGTILCGTGDLWQIKHPENLSSVKLVELSGLLIEEILHHLGCKKPCEWWDKLPINWCRISSINSSLDTSETSLPLSIPNKCWTLHPLPYAKKTLYNLDTNCNGQTWDRSKTIHK